ncbi:nucleotidyltransferase family protein [Prevotella copri]|uniref:Nucleotidyltransferase family protein n=1 Tax=Segatella copri TaxID=165179 RepID=A0AAW5UEU5_9BACT|nr:nucleotidyltransferase family protein [Segatella copri]MCW4100701.1 nucleotidyltransferase family protein [Segatella copri]MCW4133012.1 nucleotidyltransferase family protein [Segatella copri]MCW4163567.1 nucleotidyltransferase family protein [Segatella copri]
MNDITAIFAFLKYCLGSKEDMSRVIACMNWQELYSFASKQALLGLCFDGIERLGKEYPEELKQNPIGRELLMTWMGKAQQIRRQNMKVNAVAGKLFAMLRVDGMRCCVLKGQGNALMYPNPYSRTPGDIDVWIDASRERIMKYAQKKFELEDDIRLQHLETSLDGVPVELHFFPCSMNNPIYHARLQKWFKRNADLQCSHIVGLPDGAGDIAIPTTAFNVVYQLTHLYHHFFDEGIGMRQIIDYYYVVSMLNVNCEMLTWLPKKLKYLGLWKFAGAVMYVLHEVLGLSEDKMIVPMDEKRGRLLLAEILDGGNFGRHFTKYAGFTHQSMGKKYFLKIWRNMHFVRYYPAEALCEPLFRTWHFFWRLKYKK